MKQKKQKKNKEISLYKVLEEQTTDCLFIANSLCEITEVNSRAIKLTGYSKEELVGKKVESFFSDESLKSEPFRYDLLDGGGVVTRRRSFINKKGNEIQIEMTSQKLPDNRYVSIVTDISGRKARKEGMEKEIESLRAELDKKNRILSIYTITLVVKDELIQEIREANNEFEQNPEKAKEKISSLLNNRIDMYHEWALIKLHFEEVHPRFFRTLQEAGEKLTAGELKLCAYLRMQMTTKEIAAVMHINFESVNKKRNRVRKKLSMGSKQNFNAFLQGL